MSRIGYARKSTADQNLEAEIERLKQAGCEKVFSDTASGKLASRPGWDACRAYVRDGDTLVTTRLDRWGRSLAHVIAAGVEFRDKGVDIECLDQAINTSTPEGRLMFGLLALLAEFERDLLIARTREGLAATAKRGHGGGTKPKLKGYQIQHARERIDAGTHVTEVAAELGVSRMTVYRALNGSLKGQQ